MVNCWNISFPRELRNSSLGAVLRSGQSYLKSPGEEKYGSQTSRAGFDKISFKIIRMFWIFFKSRYGKWGRWMRACRKADWPCVDNDRSWAMGTWGCIISHCASLYVPKSTLKNVREKKGNEKKRKLLTCKHIKKQVSQRQTLPVLILSKGLPSLDFLGSLANLTSTVKWIY